MDPDGDYESRHSTRSTTNDGIDLDVADVASPSKIFAPEDDTKLPAKTMTGQDAYEGPTAPPMEGAPLVAAAATSNSSAMESHGTAYDDMMSGKRDITAPDEAPISNSVAVPIGFDSDDMALPEAKALPIVSSTANEGAKMPSATLEEIGVEEDTEAQIEEEPIPVPVPSSADRAQNSTTRDATSDEASADPEDKVTTTTRRRQRKLCCCGIVAFVAVLGTVLGVLVSTKKGQLIIKGYPNCDLERFWPSDIGDGDCESELNTAECGWDGGDCLYFNERYPDCHVDIIPWIGNGHCNGGRYDTARCGWDGGDCLIDGYPDCHVEDPNLIGNGHCNEGDYNTAECGWDGGDCLVDSEDEQSTPDPTQEPSTVGTLAPVSCSDFSCMDLSALTGFYQQDILLTEEKIFSDIQVLIFEDLYQSYTPFYGPGQGLVDPNDPFSSITTKCEMTGQSLETSSAYKSLWTLRVIFLITWSSRTIIVDNYPNDFRNFINANLTVVAEDMFESGLRNVASAQAVFKEVKTPAPTPAPLHRPRKF